MKCFWGMVWNGNDHGQVDGNSSFFPLVSFSGKFCALVLVLELSLTARVK